MPTDFEGADKKLRQAAFFRDHLEYQSTQIARDMIRGGNADHQFALEAFCSASLGAAQSCFYVLHKTGGQAFKTIEARWRNNTLDQAARTRFTWNPTSTKQIGHRESRLRAIGVNCDNGFRSVDANRGRTSEAGRRDASTSASRSSRLSSNTGARDVSLNMRALASSSSGRCASTILTRNDSPVGYRFSTMGLLSAD